MVHAFFDDADTLKENGHIFFAGYIGDDVGWDGFSHQWNAALHRHGLARLHTADFLSGEGEYKPFGHTYERRLEILQDFVGVIRQNVLCGVSVGVDAKAYKAVLAEAPKKASPQAFAFERLLRMSIMRIRQWPDSIPFQMVFDDSEEHSMRFYGALRDLKRKRPDIRESVTGISFCDDRFVMPLRAADLLACATVREFRRGVPAAWSDGPFVDLLRDTNPAYGILYEQEYWDETELWNRKDQLILATSNTRGAPNAQSSAASPAQSSQKRA